MSEDQEPKVSAATPPADAESDSPKRPKSKRPKGRPIALQTELEEFFTQLGAGVMILDQFDGLVIINQAGPNAEALAKLANKNARVKKALEALTAISSMGAVVGVIGGTAIPILMHHGVVPPGLPMADEWLKPPERIQFEAEIKSMQEDMKGQNGHGPGGPSTPE